MNTHKFTIIIALAMLLQVPEGMADVTISGQVEVTVTQTDSTSNSIIFRASEDLGDGISAFEYMSNETFSTFNSFQNITTAIDSNWRTNPNKLASLYSIETGPSLEWRNNSGEILTVIETTNELTTGGTSTIHSLVDSSGKIYGGSTGNSAVLTYTGYSGLLDIQNIIYRHIISVDFNNFSLVVFEDSFYRWSPLTGLTSVSNLLDLSPVTATISRPEVSPSMTDGYSTENLFLEAYRIDSNGNTVLLGTIPNNDSNCATSASTNCTIKGFSSVSSGSTDDASIIIGYAAMLDYGALSVGDLTGASFSQAFQWNEKTGMIGLGSLAGGNRNSFANAVSNDGQVVIGTASSANGLEAFRWSSDSGMSGLGDLAGGGFHSVATVTNETGSVIAGFSEWSTASNAPLFEAFRWTDATGMVGLGRLTNLDTDSFATAINKNGDIIVGASGSLEDNQLSAFRWSEASGIQSIKEWLTSTGVRVASDSDYSIAYAVNDEGTVIAGSGPNGPWFARSGKGVINATESIATTIMSTAAAPQASSSLPTMALHGAHHLPLLSQKKLSGENCAWVNGDFANYHEKKADSTLVEAGFCKDIEESTRAGLGIGKSKANQTLDHSGSSVIDGKYLLLELDHQVQDSPMLLSATLLHGNWDANINRGYLNAGAEDQSRGSTSIKATALRARVDWRDLYSLEGVTFTPKIEYTLTRSHIDGYTETTGGFPARFDPQSHTARESRIGLIIEKDLDAQTTVRGITEAVHRFDKNGADFSGEVVGLFPFSIPGSENRQDWIRLGGEVDHQLDKDSFVSFSLMRSSRGEDADVSGAISWKLDLQ